MANSAGEFFAIDARTWGKVVETGLNPAVAFLVLARFSGADNVTTTASVNAIETYTGISRGRSREAIEALVQAGVITKRRGGARPLYELGNFPERPATARTKALTEHAIWLPNQLVSGAATEVPPLELVRQTQERMVLRLLIDLYGSQNLLEDGGVDRAITWEKWERKTVGESASWRVYGFRWQGGWVHWSGFASTHYRKLTKAEEAAGEIQPGSDFFSRMQLLRDLGLIGYVPHLVEADSNTAEIIQPYGLGQSDSMEDRLGRASHHLGTALVTEAQADWARSEGLSLAPVRRHLANVAMIGIARLRYRPRTGANSRWYAELQEKGEKALRCYEEALAARQDRLQGQRRAS